MERPARISSKQFEKLLIILLGLASVFLLAVLARPALQGQIYTYDDLGHSHLPMRYFYAQALASGDSFLWAPQFYCGFYLHGDGLVGMLHPLHFLLYRTLPLTWAFNFEFLSSYLIMFAGMFWMLSRWNLPKSSALMGALTFTFSGFNLLHYMHMNAIAIMAHFPWLIGFADLLLTSDHPRKRAAAWLGLSILTGSQILLGYPQYVWLSTIGEVFFVSWKIWRGAGSGKRAAWWILAKAVGAMVGMAQILPTWDSLNASARHSPSLDFILSMSVHPVNLFQLWCPFVLQGHVYGTIAHELGVYNGAFCTVALAWPFVRRKEPTLWNSLARAAAFFAGITLLLSLGRYGVIYPWIARLPLIGLFRDPARHIVLVQWAMSVLVAIAFAEMADLIKRRECLPWKNLWPLSIPAILSLSTAGLAIWVMSQPSHSGGPIFLLAHTYSSVGRVLAGLGLMLMSTGLVVLASRGYRWSLVLLILLTTSDVMAWGMDYIIHRPTTINLLRSSPPMSVEEYLKIIPEPPDALPGRIACPRNWPWANALIMKGYRLMAGYVALEPARTLDTRSLTFQRLSNVRWTVSGDRWEKIQDPMPRVRLVTRILPDAPAAITEDRIDISKAAWVDAPVLLEPGKQGTARLSIDRPGLIAVEVSAPSRQLLIVSESYHPGWKAVLDGRPTPVLRAYGDFLACFVGPGSHQLEFRFHPASFLWGMRLTIAGLFLAAFFALLLSKSRKNEF